MFIRLALLTLLAPLLYASLSPTTARAKGSSYIVAATLDGGRLAGPVTVPVRLPENLDDMFEIAAPQGVDGASLPYALTLHYDFGERDGGKRDWVGRYDGAFTMQFPHSMVVNGNVWAAGWYTAVDVLAQALAGGVAGSTETQSLPSAGSGHSSAGWAGGAFVTLGLLGSSLMCAGLVRYRRCRGRGSATS